LINIINIFFSSFSFSSSSISHFTSLNIRTSRNSRSDFLFRTSRNSRFHSFSRMSRNSNFVFSILIISSIIKFRSSFFRLFNNILVDNFFISNFLSTSFFFFCRLFFFFRFCIFFQFFTIFKWFCYDAQWSRSILIKILMIEDLIFIKSI
jgi:hypothetical protein